MPKVQVQLEDWVYSAPMSALLLWLSLTAFFDSKLRLAVMASKTDCCRELSRGRQASEVASVFFSRHLLMAMADLQRRLKDNTIFHVDILDKAKSQH